MDDFKNLTAGLQSLTKYASLIKNFFYEGLVILRAAYINATTSTYLFADYLDWQFCTLRFTEKKTNFDIIYKYGSLLNMWQSVIDVRVSNFCVNTLAIYKMQKWVKNTPRSHSTISGPKFTKFWLNVEDSS